MNINLEAIIWIVCWVLAWQFGPDQLDKHVLRRFPPAEQPEAVRSAALLEFLTSGTLLVIGIVLMLFESFLILRVLVVISSAWVVLSWLLRRGNKTVRWFFIPLSILRLLIPIFGWIVTPFSIYFLFFNRDAKEYFKNNANQRTHSITGSAGSE